MEPLLNELVELLGSREPGSNWTRARLASVLNLSETRVQRGLDELVSLGYTIVAGSQDRIQIQDFPDRMIDTEILRGLKTRTFGRPLHCYNRIASTNTRAAQLAERGATEGTVVVAEEQTGGRGRLGRTWHSAPRLGIWSSIILRPQMPLQRASGLSLLAAVAFAQTAESELGLAIGLKWPNDGLVNGQKVLGILTEVTADADRIEYAICGTGINIGHQFTDFPEELRSKATSLRMAMGHPVDRVGFYRSYLTRFEALYRRFCRGGITQFIEDYRKRSSLLGREVVVRQGNHEIRGLALQIDEDGALVVRQGSSNTVIFAGEATLVES